MTPKRAFFWAGWGGSRLANSGAAWQPSCQKIYELAEIIGWFETFYKFLNQIWMILDIFGPILVIFFTNFWHFWTKSFKALAEAARKAWIICRSGGVAWWETSNEKLPDSKFSVRKKWLPHQYYYKQVWILNGQCYIGSLSIKNKNMLNISKSSASWNLGTLFICIFAAILSPKIRIQPM